MAPTNGFLSLNRSPFCVLFEGLKCYNTSVSIDNNKLYHAIINSGESRSESLDQIYMNCRFLCFITDSNNHRATLGNYYRYSLIQSYFRVGGYMEVEVR